MKEIKMTKAQKELMILIANARTSEYDGKKPKEQEVYEGFYDGILSRKAGKLIKNEPFEATLIYHGYSRGRSSLNIQWYDEKRKTIFNSGMALLDEVLKNKLVFDGASIKGTFWFAKKGTSILLTGNLE